MSAKAKPVASPPAAPGGSFVSDVAELRKRARREIEDGAVTPGYRGDREAVVRLLNVALATEIVCVLRYKRHYYMADGIHADPVKAEFLEHAKEEQAHADGISERIRQLGGEPDLDPSRLLGKSHTEYQEGTGLADMIREDLVAERIAIESYKEMISVRGRGRPDHEAPLRVDPRAGGRARRRPRRSPEVVRRGESPDDVTDGAGGAFVPPPGRSQAPRILSQASRTASLALVPLVRRRGVADHPREPASCELRLDLLEGARVRPRNAARSPTRTGRPARRRRNRGPSSSRGATTKVSRQ